MNHLGTIEIETKRLFLRKFHIDDADEMFYGWASKEDCSRYFPWQPCKNISEVITRIQKWVDNYSNNDFYQWAIVLKENKKVIGIINLHNVRDEYNSAETSYILNPNYWNKGYMTESLSSIIDFGFKNLKLNRICADYFEGNEQSAKVLHKCSMIKEGVEREKYRKNGNYINSVLCSILYADWEVK